MITYACGVVIDSANGFESISHTGATAGYRALLAYYPQKELSVVFLSNSANAEVGQVGSVIEEIFLGKQLKKSLQENYKGVDVKKESLADKSGIYKSTRNNDVQELDIRNDSLEFKRSSVTLVPVSENKFIKEGFLLEFPAGKQPKTMLMQKFVFNYY